MINIIKEIRVPFFMVSDFRKEMDELVYQVESQKVSGIKDLNYIETNEIVFSKMVLYFSGFEKDINSFIQTKLKNYINKK